MATETFSGARAIFGINGQPIGFTSACRGEESIQYEPVDVLDLLRVKEWVPVGYRASLSTGIFRVPKSPLKKYTKAGGLEIFPLEANILTSGDLDCSVVDRLTGEVIGGFIGCKAQAKTFDIGPRGLVMDNLSFVAIAMADESEIPAVA